jgi:ABC-type lipopolysaccharide export system ATPase subunit
MLSAFIKNELFTRMEIEDLFEIVSNLIKRKNCKFSLKNQTINENGFEIKGKTGIQWLQNAYTTYLTIYGSIVKDDLIKIEIIVRSKWESFTQKKTNQRLIDQITIDLENLIVVERNEKDDNY